MVINLKKCNKIKTFQKKRYDFYKYSAIDMSKNILVYKLVQWVKFLGTVCMFILNYYFIIMPNKK